MRFPSLYWGLENISFTDRTRTMDITKILFACMIYVFDFCCPRFIEELKKIIILLDSCISISDNLRVPREREKMYIILVFLSLTFITRVMFSLISYRLLYLFFFVMWISIYFVFELHLYFELSKPKHYYIFKRKLLNLLLYL